MGTRVPFGQAKGGSPNFKLCNMNSLRSAQVALRLHLYEQDGYCGPQPRHPVREFPMGCSWVGLSLSRCLAFAAFLFVVLPTSQAQTVDVSGRYQCAQVKIHGKVIPCTAAPLILKNDGRFELRGWEGSYLVNGEWVELTDSLLKTRARIEPGHKIVLRYYGKHGLVEMTYERRVAQLGKTALT